MAEFSIPDVAFTGFRVVRRHPKALIAWWVYALVLTLAFAIVLMSLAGPDVARLVAYSAQPNPDPAQFVLLMERLAPASAVLLLVEIAFYSVVSAAMIRSVLRPRDDRFGFLRVGMDELRQFGLGLLTVVVFLGSYVSLIVVIQMLASLALVAGRETAAAIIVLLLPFLLGVLLVLAVRLSLAPALTFDTRRIRLLESWALTRHRFWSLLGTYLLTIALVATVYFLSVLLIYAVTAIFNGGNPAASSLADAISARSYLSPTGLLQAGLSAGVCALVWPVLFAPSAAIYSALASSGDAFS